MIILQLPDGTMVLFSGNLPALTSPTQGRTQEFPKGGARLAKGGALQQENSFWFRVKKIFPYSSTGTFFPKGGARASEAPPPLGTPLVRQVS